MSSRPPQPVSSRRAHTRRSHPRPRKSASCSLLTITSAAFHPRHHMGDPSATPKIPIAPAQPNRASSSPRFPPYEAFGRRPRAQSQRRLQRAGVRNPSVNRTLRIATVDVAFGRIAPLYMGHLGKDLKAAPGFTAFMIEPRQQRPRLGDLRHF